MPCHLAGRDDSAGSNGWQEAGIVVDCPLPKRDNIVREAGRPHPVHSAGTTASCRSGEPAGSPSRDSMPALQKKPASEYPCWWRWYRRPRWRQHVNGVGRIAWKMTLDPGKGTEPVYTWHNFWR